MSLQEQAGTRRNVGDVLRTQALDGSRKALQIERLEGCYWRSGDDLAGNRSECFCSICQTSTEAYVPDSDQQQKIWLNCSEDELPVQEVVAQVTQQVIQDSATGSEPPLQ